MRKNVRAMIAARLAAATPTPIPALASELSSLDEEDGKGVLEMTGRGEVVEEEAKRLVVEAVDEDLGTSDDGKEVGGGV